ncbi:hypothetical protein RCZ04_08950 [Capnocytophaga sp. HP1101]
MGKTFEQLKSLITSHDLDALFDFCNKLTESERLELLEQLQHSGWGVKESTFFGNQTPDKFKKTLFLETPKQSDYEFNVALFLLTQSEEEYQHLPIHQLLSYGVSAYKLFTDGKALRLFIRVFKEEKYHFLIDLFKHLKPNEREFISFEAYWVLYKAGIIPFDHALFTKNITATYLYDDKIARYSDLVLNDKEFHELIFRRLHCYENQMFHDAKPWEAFFVHLQKQGYTFTRKYIPELLESLLNLWKRPQLNWHCRWLEFLQPTAKELLTSQQTLFALLGTGNANLINFAIKHISTIAKEKDFDFPAFADNFALCFTTQKIAKSQLIGLNILEQHYKKQAPTNTDYREQLAVLFTIPDVKLQEKVARLLTAYFGGEGLDEVVVPYRDYLKGKAQELFSDQSGLSDENLPNKNLPPAPLRRGNYGDANPNTYNLTANTYNLTPITYPLTPDNLLFLLGDCLRERSAATIEVFLEGFNQLQNQLPADMNKQLAPYLKQMNKHWGGTAAVPILEWFLLHWLGEKKTLRKEDKQFFEETLPYLFDKVQLLLKKLDKKDKLPFLATPTHAPFYIEAEVLMDRLLQYESANTAPDLHDLVVACNRLLFKEVSAAAKEKAQQLKGAYAKDILYYVGLTDEVKLAEELLPLWAQITRIKHPNREFPEFENTTAKDIPSVVKPFTLDFEVKMRKQSAVTFYYLDLADNWNDNFDRRQKPVKAPIPYYNAGICDVAWGSDVLYQCSLNPHYIEAQITRYTASYGKGNESGELEHMQLPMQALVEHHLPVYHGGWLYVAVALLFEKRPTRDLANAYILERLQAGANLDYAAQVIGKLLAEQYAPISRFMEFLDMPTRDPKVKDFEKKAVDAYLALVENLDKKPTNHKKLADFVM